jgi:hypothetical protein
VVAAAVLAASVSNVKQRCVNVPFSLPPGGPTVLCITNVKHRFDHPNRSPQQVANQVSLKREPDLVVAQQR